MNRRILDISIVLFVLLACGLALFNLNRPLPPAPILVLDEAGNAHRILLGSYPTGGQLTVTLSNGLNSNIATQGLSSIRIVGPTAAFTIGGFTPGQAGNELLVTNTTAQVMTVLPGDVSTTPKGQIDTQSLDAGVILQPKQGAIRFIYDGQESKWVLSGTGPARPDVCNVLDYGADPSGINDSTASFVKAIAACGNGSSPASAGTTRVPPGTYTLSAALALPPYENLSCDGFEAAKLNWTSATDGLDLQDVSVSLHDAQTVTGCYLNSVGHVGLVGINVANRGAVTILRNGINGWSHQGIVCSSCNVDAFTENFLSGNGSAPDAGLVTWASDPTDGGVLTVNVTGAAFATDAAVMVRNVGGQTGANGDWFVTQVDSGTYQLQGSGGAAVGAYTSGERSRAGGTRRRRSTGRWPMRQAA